MSITDWPPTRSERKVADPTTIPLRTALDAARAEAKAAWDAFEAERIRIAASDIDLTEDTQTLQAFDDLYQGYLAKSAVVEELQARWEASLSRNGHEQESPGNGHKGKLAKAVLDNLDVKTLISPQGGVVAPQMLPVIVAESLRATSILALYATQTTTADQISYIQETSETLAAAPVAVGAAKPVSAIATQVVSTPVRTIATVSEALDRQTLMDFQLFSSWIEGRLRTSVQLAIESQTISGNGTAPNLRGIMNTAGVAVAGPPSAGQTMADAIALGVAALEADNVVPNAVAMNSSDFWTMRLVREGATTGPYLYADPGVQGPANLWGLPVIRSSVIPAGQAIVADWTKATLAIREDTTVQWADAHSDLFTKNQVVVRVESRVAFACAQPSAFCLVDLAA